jgi:hypothetical protein
MKTMRNERTSVPDSFFASFTFFITQVLLRKTYFGDGQVKQAKDSHESKGIKNYQEYPAAATLHSSNETFLDKE